MEAKKFGVVSIALCWLCLQVSEGVELDLTIEISAGDTECFWQHLKQESSTELEYQVIDGGDLDIDFSLFAPDGRELRKDFRKIEDVVRIKPETEGDYKFCFGNSFSTMSAKVVFFEMISTHDEDDEEDEDWKFEMEEVSDMVDMTVEDIKGIVDRSKVNLMKSIQLQNLIKMHEARDRNIAEANYFRVNTFSAFQLFIMITVSLTQVLMIRSLFQDKSGRQGFRQKT